MSQMRRPLKGRDLVYKTSTFNRSVKNKDINLEKKKDTPI